LVCPICTSAYLEGKLSHIDKFDVDLRQVFLSGRPQLDRLSPSHGAGTDRDSAQCWGNSRGWCENWGVFDRIDRDKSLSIK
jgi:hypothetical protein